jgi:hypothetical protein
MSCWPAVGRDKLVGPWQMGSKCGDHNWPSMADQDVARLLSGLIYEMAI